MWENDAPSLFSVVYLFISFLQLVFRVPEYWSVSTFLFLEASVYCSVAFTFFIKIFGIQIPLDCRLLDSDKLYQNVHLSDDATPYNICTNDQQKRKKKEV